MLLSGDGILLLEIYISMENATFPGILEQPQNPRLKKGDMEQVSYLIAKVTTYQGYMHPFINKCYTLCHFSSKIILIFWILPLY
jgi:hypothetical protein